MTSVLVEETICCEEKQHSQYKKEEMVVCHNCGQFNCPDCLSYTSDKCYWCDSKISED